MYKTIRDTLGHIEIYSNGCDGKIVAIREIKDGLYEALIEYKEEQNEQRKFDR